MKTRWMVAVAMAAALSCGIAQANNRLARRQVESMAPPSPPAMESVGGAPGAWEPSCSPAQCGEACDSYGSCDSGCFTGCGKSCWILDAEVAFLRYHRTAGVDAGLPGTPGNGPQDIEFDFNATPRVTVGWVAPSGVGVRFRWWDYDHDARATNGSGDFFSVDAFTMDLEVFEEIRLTKKLWLEGSGGVRLLSFREDAFRAGVIDGGSIGATQLTGTNSSSRFGALGGVAGLQLKRDTTVGTLFVRARYSILMADSAIEVSAIENDVILTTQRRDLFDTVQSVAEIAVGWELNWELQSGGIFSVRAGAEFQQWMNFDYNSPYARADLVPADVGFGGFFAGAGLKF